MVLVNMKPPLHTLVVLLQCEMVVGGSIGLEGYYE